MLVATFILQPLITVFEAVIRFFHDTAGFGWGLSIIAMTLVVRAALLPLTLKQSRSMQAMQRLQPQMKALQAKYKDDKQRLNQEMMKFYQENKVNPFASCLPIVAQLPVFFSLYFMLRKDLKERICGPALHAYVTAHHASFTNTPCGAIHQPSKFLFVPDLTSKATGGVLVALLILYVGSQLASSVLMSVSADRNQRLLLMAMPFFFILFVIRFPAGLLIYWITTNLWTIGQQYIVRKTVGPPVVHAKVTKEGDDADGKPARRGSADSPKGAPAPATAAGPAVAPPPPPRKKKKRSGRRR